MLRSRSSVYVQFMAISSICICLWLMSYYSCSCHALFAIYFCVMLLPKWWPVFCRLFAACSCVDRLIRKNGISRGLEEKIHRHGPLGKITFLFSVFSSTLWFEIHVVF
uniref:Uncharacterized protein n=1 Tax=Aegilops tauschii subsp. strangulata TaxID=200361 RepID=A0A452XMH1_AEGTS